MERSTEFQLSWQYEMQSVENKTLDFRFIVVMVSPVCWRTLSWNLTKILKQLWCWVCFWLMKAFGSIFQSDCKRWLLLMQQLVFVCAFRLISLKLWDFKSEGFLTQLQRSWVEKRQNSTKSRRCVVKGASKETLAMQQQKLPELYTKIFNMYTELALE